jgi:hypothetical protein
MCAIADNYSASEALCSGSFGFSILASNTLVLLSEF